MRSSGINGEGELRGQPANPGSHGKMAVLAKCECVRVCACEYRKHPSATQHTLVQQPILQGDLGKLMSKCQTILGFCAAGDGGDRRAQLQSDHHHRNINTYMFFPSLLS